jgi:hypothetical protein
MGAIIRDIRDTSRLLMDDIQNQDQPQNDDTIPQDKHGLSRRDLLKVGAILTGSMLLMLSRCKPPFEERPLEIPPNFKRFVLVEQSPAVPTEKIIVALGLQCPDWKCSLWLGSNEEIRFFDSVEQIDNEFVKNGRAALVWLD